MNSWNDMGAYPEELSNLLSIVAMKKELMPLRISKLERSPRQPGVFFSPRHPG